MMLPSTSAPAPTSRPADEISEKMATAPPSGSSVGAFARLLSGEPRARAGERADPGEEREAISGDEPADADPTRAEESALTAEQMALALMLLAPSVPPAPPLAVPVVDSSRCLPLQGDPVMEQSLPIAAGPMSISEADPPTAVEGGGAANSADPQKNEEIEAGTESAKSAGATMAAAPGKRLSENIRQPWKAHEYLNPGRLFNSEMSHGTGGAKADAALPMPASHPIFFPSDTAPAEVARGLVPSGVQGLAGALLSQGFDAPQDGEGGNNPTNDGSDANQWSNVPFPSFHAPAGQTNGAGRAFGKTVEQPVLSAAVFDGLSNGLERMRQQGDSRVDLQLALEGGAKVDIQLRFQNGVVHASVLTGSPELREALRQQWTDLANRSETVGFRLAAPTFESNPQNATGFAGQHSGGQQQNFAPDDSNAGLPGLPPVAPLALLRTASRTDISQTAESALSAWA